MTEPVYFGVLGTTVVHRPEGTLTQFPEKTSQVLALLLTSLGRTVPTTRLVRSIWGYDPPSSARIMVREHIKKIRSGLGDAGREGLVAGNGGYRLAREVSVLDADVFESLARQGQLCCADGDPVGAEQHFLDALGLWRDFEAFTDVRDVLDLEAEAVRLEELRVQSEQGLVECYLASGRADMAIPYLRKLTVRYPSRERFWSLLMAAQSALGRRPEASATYRLARRFYVEENGMSPSDHLNALHEGILRGQPSEEIIRNLIAAPGFQA